MGSFSCLDKFQSGVRLGVRVVSIRLSTLCTQYMDLDDG